MNENICCTICQQFCNSLFSALLRSASLDITRPLSQSMLLWQQCNTQPSHKNSVSNPASLTLVCRSLSLASSRLHPSLPRRPLRGRFYSVWITCPSWRWACWWEENLFPLVEPWFKALRSTWFWVIVSPVVMNQGSGSQQTAYRQKGGVAVQVATTGQLNSAKKHFSGDLSFCAQK